MQKVRQMFVTHYVALILALVTACIVVFPHVYFRIDHRDDGIYQGIELFPDSPWSARIREVQDGHPTLGSIYHKEGKDNPYLLQPFGSMVIGYTGTFLGLEINNTILFSKFTLTFLAFILIYSFIFLFSGSILAALSSTAILLLVESVLHVSGLRELFAGRSPDDFLRIGRPVYPALIYIFYFSFLAVFWQFFKSKKWYLGVLSAVILGLNFYTYFYAWTYLFAFGGLLGLFLLVTKKWHDAVRVACVYIGAVFLTIPYWFNMLRAAEHPVYEEAGLRYGVVETHMPLFVGFVVLAALAIFLFRFPKDDQERWLVGLALMLAPFVTLNQQILTGKVLQEGHYHWFFHKPMAIIFALIIVFSLLVRRGLHAYAKGLAVLVLVGSFGIGTFVQLYTYWYGTREGGAVAIQRQAYGPVMDWLNEHAQKEAVVLSNDTVSHLVVIYTPLNVFYHRAAVYALSSPTERLLDVLFSFYRLRGITADDAEKVFFDERAYISTNIYGIYYRELHGSYETIPNEKISEIIAKYKETLNEPAHVWLERTLRKYQVEYLVWDTTQDPLWRLEQYPFLKKEAGFGHISIFSMESEQ